ncbi:hypothetical protein PV08_02749 [Exophiala spinifera]|uniref:EF-hand domain-containing protein n=1 Tax=Exophiala spinifera TaxID=91928 RepID=A0A0D1YT47_9EURO|nr:uncharacterized protein PV08_02749 [Exophiala spinifera]KIW18461.1 hypothetical protein PV08_02749 [Exophiala spinifera]
MSTYSRENSRDRAESRIVKHQHSFSESGRSSVPMWDSSDPDRAPPPLPLNPGGPGSPITRSNTSKRIDEAAALITAKARENAPSSYTSNPPPTCVSPDRNIMRAQNRRMQSIQSPSINRLSDSLERRSPEKGLRTARFVDFEDLHNNRTSERPRRSETPTPSERKSRDFENTPPGSNMLALQSVRNRQDPAPLGDITNGTSPPIPNFSFDSLSSQILSLTSIVTNVQKEMASLNKRSKDNYTDLMGLKEAATSRDEDIRKSLRELVAGLETKLSSLDTRLLSASESSRPNSTIGGLYLDDKAHNITTPRKSFGLPRIGSPTSFSAQLEREMSASPSLACVDGAASIALLEKVLREMATREGQDNIINTLEAVKSQVAKSSNTMVPTQSTVDPNMMSKLEDVLNTMKELKTESGSRALIRSNGNENLKRTSHLDVFLEDTASPKSKPNSEGRASFPGSDNLTEEIAKTLKSVKQSMAHNGGLTNEVKVLVRELRGEVLGMGREIGRKLEQSALAKGTDPDAHTVFQTEIATTVQQGLAELKEHFHQIVHENRGRSMEVARSSNDTQELVRAVRNALAEMPQPTKEPVRDPAAEREELLVAVREAWEDCKPEIALEHFGLERDEILECLKEGLKSYQPQQSTVQDTGVTYDEVVQAVQKGLADYTPPTVPTPIGISQDEVFLAVRQCLDSFEWQNVHLAQPSDAGLTREDVTGAVEEALARQELVTQDFVTESLKNGVSQSEPVAKEIEFNREDLFDAIRACLEGDQNPLGGMGEKVIEAMHEFLGSMKTEFQQYSAASGKDTEQVLDALKDGLEDLRADIESYVDRAADVTGKDEIIDTVKAGFAAMQADIDKGFATRTGGAPNTPELLDAMEKEFEHLRDTINKGMARNESLSDKDEILDAIRDLSDDRQSSLSGNTEDLARLVKEELEHMRATLAGTLIKNGSSLDRDEVLDAIREGLEASRSGHRMDGSESILSNTSELLDAFQDGVDGIRADIQKLNDRPIDLSASEEVLDALKASVEGIREDIFRLHEKEKDGSDSGTARGQEMVIHDQNRISTEIEGLKVMITQLRIKVEALDGLGATAVPSETRLHRDDMNELQDAIQHVGETIAQTSAEEVHVHRDDLDGIYTAINEVHSSVNRIRDAGLPEVVMPENAASKDDTDAIETLLRNIKARLDEVLSPESEPLAKSSQLDAVEFGLKDLKEVVEECTQRSGEQTHKEDFTIIELMLKDVQGNIEDFKSKLDGVNRDDNGSISKTDVEVIKTLCMDIKSQMESIKLPSLDGLPTKEDINDVKNDIKSFREQFEADNGLTAQAFEARKIEHGGLATKIDDVKSIISDVRDEFMAKVDGSAEGIVELNKVLGMHHDDMSKYATSSSIAKMSEMIKTELERHMDHHANIKSEMEERDATLFNKHEETGADIKMAIEEKFIELMTKYDDAQQANEIKLAALEERDGAHLEATTGTRAVADELKLLIDTLGSTVTETCERVSEDSKTVFTSIEDSNSKLENLHSANAFEHGVTREEVAKTLAAVTRLEGSVAEKQPALLSAIQQVLGVVSQHYEHSQQQSESFTRATEEIKSGVDSIPSAIPPLLPALPATPASPEISREVPVHEKYDDSEVHDKLDTLLSHAALAKEVFAGIENRQNDTRDSLAGLSKLDEIHAQVMATAAEIASMVTTQARLMGEHHESKVAEAAEAAIALEKRTAQKEKVEADIVALNQEKNVLVEAMASLKREQEELSGQTKRLNREVAKLETALQLRQEEIRQMNLQAEAVERRIVDGLVNQARSIHPKRSKARGINSAERDASMSLKRVPSNATTVTAKASVKDGNSSIGSAVGMALKKRAPLTSNARASTTPRTSAVDRRILSTSHVTGNRGRNTPDMALMLAPAPKPATGLVSLKRSQSVKSNPSSYANGRKASWNGVTSELTDKENFDMGHDESEDDSQSDASTERRTSLGTSYMYTDSMTYGTGSSLSGRSRLSTGSSIVGTVNGRTESIAEEDEEQAVDSTALVLHDAGQVNSGQDNSMAITTLDGLETPNVVAEVLSDLQPPPLLTAEGLKYHLGSDSGLGTEPLTAGTEERIGEAQEYFRMTAQEMQQ